MVCNDRGLSILTLVVLLSARTTTWWPSRARGLTGAVVDAGTGEGLARVPVRLDGPTLNQL